MKNTRLRTGTHVRISPKWDKAHFHKGVGVGTIDGKWFDSYTVDFGYVPPGAPTKYKVNVPGEFLIVTKEAPRSYKHPNSPTLAKVESFTENLHGSGINYKWSIEETKTSFRASNAYDVMNEGGFELGGAEFTVIFPKNESMGEFKFKFNSPWAQRMNQRYMLRDYLEDTIGYTLNTLNLR